MSYVGKVTIGSATHSVASTLYGICATAASTAAKEVTCAEFDEFLDGVTIAVMFENGSTAIQSLDVNDLGRVDVLPITTNTVIGQGGVVSFTYDDTSAQWVMHGIVPTAANGLPTGGTAGQVLAKNSATDYDVGWVNQSGGSGRQTTYYTTCSTTASTAAKVITVSEWTPTAGDILAVLFTTANTTAAPTLNVNGAGAKSIYVGNAVANSTTNVLKWSAQTFIWFMFDGTYFRYIASRAAASVVPPDGAGSWYGTSSTAATTAAKVVTNIANFRLVPGAVVHVQCSTANTYVAGALTLAVQSSSVSTGAKTIYVNGAATSATNTLTWSAGDMLTFVYSGSYWYYCGSSSDEDTTYSLSKSGTTVTLSGSDSSSSVVDVSAATVLFNGTASTSVTLNQSADSFTLLVAEIALNAAQTMFADVTTTPSNIAAYAGSVLGGDGNLYLKTGQLTISGTSATLANRKQVAFGTNTTLQSGLTDDSAAVIVRVWGIN